MRSKGIGSVVSAAVVFAAVGACILSDVGAQEAGMRQSTVAQAISAAFPGSTVRIAEGQPDKAAIAVMEPRPGAGPEKLEVSTVMACDVSAGTNLVLLSVRMLDRAEKIRESIDRREYGPHEETGCLLMLLEGRNGELDVRRLSASGSNEVAVSYGECEELAILGPTRKQVAVTYAAAFQKEDDMGGRQTRTIYDIPTGRELFKATVGYASTSASKKGQQWLLSYHDVPNQPAKDIHLSKKGEAETDVYTFDGTAFVFSRREPAVREKAKTVPSGEESYRQLMEWKGGAAATNEPPTTNALRNVRIEFRECSDAELTALVEAAYPTSRRIEIVERLMSVNRYRDATNWTGEVEVAVEDASSQVARCYLSWPARCVLTNGVTLLSGLVLPDQISAACYSGACDERRAKNETTKAVFVSVKLDGQGRKTAYCDVVADGVYGVRDFLPGKGSIRAVPGQGIFRTTVTRALGPRGCSGVDAAGLVEETWTRIYELNEPRLVFEVPRDASLDGTSVFTVVPVLQWRDVDADRVDELIIKDAKSPGYMYGPTGFSV